MNWEANARSNYFRVKDETAFRDWAERRGLHVAATEQGNERYFAIWPLDGGAWPSTWHNIDTDEEGEFDLIVELARHLAEEDVAVLMEIGHEGLRALAGVAVAVNAQGETRRVCLSDIYELARPLGKQITKAEY